jgi:hypothetical protein
MTMCPVCFASTALVLAGTSSGGGVAAFLVTWFRRKERTKEMNDRKGENDNKTAECGIISQTPTPGLTNIKSPVSRNNR